MCSCNGGKLKITDEGFFNSRYFSPSISETSKNVFISALIIREEIFTGRKFGGFCGFGKNPRNYVSAKFNKVRDPHN